MEKICIVKRRREYAQPEVKITVTQPELSEIKAPEIAIKSVLAQNTIAPPDNKMIEAKPVSLPETSRHIISDEIKTSNIVESSLEEQGKKIVEEFVEQSSSVISIVMTKEQSDLLKQSEYIKELINGVKNDPALDVKLTSDGRLSLNYRFNDSLLLRMLAPNQVCQMLQVSRSFLQKIINEKKIKSYKLGRIRRFLLEDILDYLSSDNELSQYNNEQ